MSKPLTAWIEGIGFLAPGLPDWPTARAVLRGEQAYENAPSVLPAPAILPPAERRRASRVVKLTLAIGLEAAALDRHCHVGNGLVVEGDHPGEVEVGLLLVAARELDRHRRAVAHSSFGHVVGPADLAPAG